MRLRRSLIREICGLNNTNYNGFRRKRTIVYYSAVRMRKVVTSETSVNTKFISGLFLTLLFCFACPAQQLRTSDQREKILLPKVFKNSQGATLLYRLYVPENNDEKKKYPLVLYLHGGGGRGNDNRKQIDGGNAYLIDLFTGADTQARYLSFVVAPQSPMEGWIEQDFVTPDAPLATGLRINCRVAGGVQHRS